MVRIDTHQLGVEQGSLLLFSDFQDGGEMWTGHGAREMRRVVDFSESFSVNPVVSVSISMLDMDTAKNHRVDIAAEDIGREGFTIVFKTWGDTKIARVRVDWTAFGAVRHEEDWDIR